jgi:hypothetical protein
MNEYTPLPVEPQTPKAKGNNLSWVVLGVIIGAAISVIVFILAIQGGYTPFFTNETLVNQSILYYNFGFNNGVVHTANYTSVTQNFTYIDENNELKVYRIKDYCDLNNEGGK